MHTYVLQRFANSTNSRVYDYEHNHYAADVYRSKGALKKLYDYEADFKFCSASVAREIVRNN